MVRFSWLSEVRHARSSAAILALARRFLAEWSPVEIALLPPGCWPPVPPASVDELVEIALRVERQQAAFAQSGGPAVLRELLSFFTQAAIRALQLELEASRGAGRQAPG